MEFHVQSEGRVAILRLGGRFDAYETPPVAEWLMQNSAAQSRILVDLENVHFIDSKALATLVQGMKHCREHGGDLRLCHLSKPVRVIFELTRLDRAFEIFDNRNAGLESFHDS